MWELPISIKVGDNEFKIRNNGDYRVILDCFSALGDEELTEEERVISSFIIFYEDFNSYEDVISLDGDTFDTLLNKMYSFMNCNEPQSPNVRKDKLVDWTSDANVICSGINKVVGFEIRSVEYCHWFTFMGYYMGIGDSLFSTIVAIRDKISRGKQLEKYEKEFKRDNPQYFGWDRRTTQQKSDDELIRSMFNL